jgi:UDP-N-acetylglucosamine 2-epimerase (non-hydrolysing)
MVVVGTRPEAIKLAPVVNALRARSGLRTIVCATGQHCELLAEALTLFGIEPDVDLKLMRPAQAADAFLAAAKPMLRQVFTMHRPQMVIVQGDTASALAGAQAGAASGIAVGHVEAGLRSGDLASPYPEEGYRRSIGRLATLHFAPTYTARDALLAEGVAGDRIYLTGNSGIDALHAALARLSADHRLAAQVEARFALLEPTRPIVLVTAHRRESFGAPLASIVAAVRRLAERGDVQILLPVHPNPSVRRTVEDGLVDVPGVHLTQPLDYLGFVYALRRARLVLTDSGGVQEEAPALGVPVLVMRDTTERPEGIASGNAKLVGTGADAIFEAAARLLDDDHAHAAMANARSPYGDGHAAERIAAAVRNWLAEAALTLPHEAALA